MTNVLRCGSRFYVQGREIMSVYVQGREIMSVYVQGREIMSVLASSPT
jgi:hypothetical protein